NICGSISFPWKTILNFSEAETQFVVKDFEVFSGQKKALRRLKSNSTTRYSVLNKASNSI
ncbi:hypothetical protein Avbf_15319, partial [Armadillidium vulgare]